MSSSRWDIPDDWNGDDWACYALAWPQSEGYRRLLHSILYSLTRGRDYDEDTGTIKDAQAVGWSIFDENIPLIECGAGGEPEIIETIKYVDRLTGGGFAGLMERLNMLTKVYVDYDTCELVVQSGQCCEQRFNLSCVVGMGGGGIPDEDFEDFEDIPESLGAEFTGCAKAVALVDVLVDAIDAVFDVTASAQPEPTQVLRELRSRYPQLTFGALDVTAAWSHALNVYAAGLVAQTEDATIGQKIKCALAPIMPTGPIGITGAQYDTFVQTVRNVVDGHIDHVTYPVFASNMRSVWRYMAQAIGKNDARGITTFREQRETDNCACPGAGAYPADEDGPEVTGGWYLGASLPNYSEYRTVGSTWQDTRLDGAMYNTNVHGWAWKIQFGTPLAITKRMLWTEATSPPEPGATSVFANTSDNLQNEGVQPGGEFWWIDCGTELLANRLMASIGAVDFRRRDNRNSTNTPLAPYWPGTIDRHFGALIQYSKDMNAATLVECRPILLAIAE